MSEDLTDNLAPVDRAILTAIQNLDHSVGRIDSRLQGLEQKVEGLERKVDGLEQKVEARLHDTRPIWHKVVADFAESQAGQLRLEEVQQAMRIEIGELHNTVRIVNRDQIVINDVLRRIQLDFHNLDERLYRLSIDRNQSNSST